VFTTLPSSFLCPAFKRDGTGEWCIVKFDVKLDRKNIIQAASLFREVAFLLLKRITEEG